MAQHSPLHLFLFFYIGRLCHCVRLKSFCFLILYTIQVVMAVAQLYFHLAPKAEVGVIAKALVRLLRSHR